jgi:hypothetical protein
MTADGMKRYNLGFDRDIQHCSMQIDQSGKYALHSEALAFAKSEREKGRREAFEAVIKCAGRDAIHPILTLSVEAAQSVLSTLDEKENG